MKTIWPKLETGSTYRFQFSNPQTDRLVYEGTWTVELAQGRTAGAFRAYVARWTKFGNNNATITKEEA